ncbi:MAG: AI-2E family transporter [Pseudomonadota bacterium]
MITRRTLWIGALILLVVWFSISIRGILLPFVAGMAVAYFLDPAADKLEAFGAPRWLATMIIIVGFFLLVIGLMIGTWPLLQSQLAGIIEVLPKYAAQVKPYLQDLMDRASGGDNSSILATVTNKLVQVIGRTAGQFISGGLALFNLLSLLLIAPVVAFYLLRDFDLMTAKLRSWVPYENRETVNRLLHEIDLALAGFVRGQILVSIFMGALYALGWSLIGLDYALILGILAGILAFIPFVGPIFGSGLALIVGFGQFGPDPVQLGLVFAVFVAVQAIEGMVLTPRLVGGRVGLHAVWVLLAVFAGGELMGFVGILIAVPVAAIIAVLSRFAVERYLESDFYHQGRPLEEVEAEKRAEEAVRNPEKPSDETSDGETPASKADLSSADPALAE